MPCDKPIIGQAIHWLSQSELLLSHTAQGRDLGPNCEPSVRSEKLLLALGFTSLSPVSPCLFCQSLS